MSSTSSLRAWCAVALLTLAYILSFIDRQILGLLITPIKGSLQLTDTQLGLLMGPAFAIFYVSLGWPIGWMADRFNRRNIIVAGVALWSIMTALCGLSRSFGQLFLSRIGVGVGEATLTPSALSLIGDMFPKGSRARATAIYMGGVQVGTGLAYLVGGKVSGMLSKAGTVDVPIFGAIEGWQAAFLAVGLPGLLVALAIMGIREPARLKAGDEPTEALSLWAALRYIGSRWTAYVPVGLGMCAVTTAAYAGGWTAALFQRTWSWPIETMGFWLGVNYLVFGPLGAVVGGMISDAFIARGMSAPTYRACWIGIGFTSVAATLYPLMPSPELALALIACSIFGNAIGTGMGSASMVVMAPGIVRAQAVALYLMTINFLGLLIGPTMVGVLTDHVFTDKAGVGHAMATVQIGVAIPALLIMWAGWKPFVREMKANAAYEPR